MQIANQLPGRLILAGALAVGLLVAQPTNAAGTAAGDTITNLATIDYEVNNIPQTPIESSPTGNSTPGVGNGTATSFVVDNRVDLTLVEVGGALQQVSPGQPAAVATFSLTNTGNETQGYALTAANLATGTTVFGGADTIDANNVRAFADTDGSGTFTAGDLQFVDSLAPDANILVFAVVDIPIGATNVDFTHVSLQAATANAGTSGATLTAQTTGGNTVGVDVVFADAGNDGLELAQDGFQVVSAALTVSKAEVLVSDPINGTTNPLHIPGAVIEYTITIVNSGTAAATNVSVSDVVNGSLSVATGSYNGNTADIEYTLAGATAYCTADAGDGDNDNCGLTGSTLEADVNATLGTNAGVDNTLVVRFRATIN